MTLYLTISLVLNVLLAWIVYKQARKLWAHHRAAKRALPPKHHNCRCVTLSPISNPPIELKDDVVAALICQGYKFKFAFEMVNLAVASDPKAHWDFDSLFRAALLTRN